MHFEMHRQIDLNLLYVVCDREKGEKAVAVLEGQKSFFNLAALGHGTANSRTLAYLGIGESEKALIFSILPAHVAEDVMTRMDNALHLDRPGHGIAFRARIHEGCYHRPVSFAGQQNGGEEMNGQSTHDLIYVVMNRGYTEEVMDVARGAGARGGTVLHARGCGMTGAEKFFGVTIQPEKEVLMIVAENTVSCEVMGAIGEAVGPGTDASAVSFSLPLTAVKGLVRQPGE